MSATLAWRRCARCRRAWSAAAAAARRTQHVDASAEEAEAAATPRALIRNFGIIAHVDHGKSTLADQLMRRTRTISDALLQQRPQLLDDMELERERGITIKLRAVRMAYEEYQLNLIDTPGHVDFSYEVSRALAAVEGAILLVDATQGVQAQTLANVDLALENDVELLPVINKVDLPHARPLAVAAEIERLIGLPAREALFVSAKSGLGVDALLAALPQRVPAPSAAVANAGQPAPSDGDGDDDGELRRPLRALIFDSYYDVHRGVVLLVRLFGGMVRRGDRVALMARAAEAAAAEYTVEEVGVFLPQRRVQRRGLRCGEVGYVIAGVRAVRDAPVGDTLTVAAAAPPRGAAPPPLSPRTADKPLPGYRRVKPVVYCGLFAPRGEEFSRLRAALLRLQLSDASVEFVPEDSAALGRGFRCGFLGLLHVDIVRQRLRREHDLDVITTAPSVLYRVKRRPRGGGGGGGGGDDEGEEFFYTSQPTDIPGDARVVEEPYALGEMLAPAPSQGALAALIRARRGAVLRVEHIGGDGDGDGDGDGGAAARARVRVRFSMPLAEVVSRLHDEVKAASHGYASVEYALDGWRAERPLARMDVFVAEEAVPALCRVVPVDDAARRARPLLRALAQRLPRQQFRVSLSAKLRSRTSVASEVIPAMKKDVTAKCYGGDVTRKRKLLNKQREGKRRMQAMGSVSVSVEVIRELVNL